MRVTDSIGLGLGIEPAKNDKLFQKFSSKSRAGLGEAVVYFFTAYEHFRLDFEIMHPEEPPNCFVQKPVSIDRIVRAIIKKVDEQGIKWRR